MKRTTKFFAVAAIAVATLFGSKVKAQTTTPANKWRFGIGVEGAVTTGSLNNYSNLALGGTARLQYGLTNHVALMLTSGYYNAFGTTVPYTDGTYKYASLGIVPIKVGAKVYMGKFLYVSGEVGAALEVKDNYYDQAKHAKLLLAPGLGYSLKNIDFSVHYDSMGSYDNNYGLVALRIAYGFSLSGNNGNKK